MKSFIPQLSSKVQHLIELSTYQNSGTAHTKARCLMYCRKSKSRIKSINLLFVYRLRFNIEFHERKKIWMKPIQTNNSNNINYNQCFESFSIEMNSHSPKWIRYFCLCVWNITVVFKELNENHWQELINAEQNNHLNRK